jgi:hypothetical protein
MGRIADLCGEVAAEADEGEDGLVLSPDAWERLRDEWTDEEIEDALALVRESYLQSELVESADSLSGRLLEALGAFGDAAAFQRARSEGALLTVEVVGQLARRVARLEEALDAFRDGPPPERTGFDLLRRRLADLGIEDEMASDEDADSGPPDDDDAED